MKSKILSLFIIFLLMEFHIQSQTSKLEYSRFITPAPTVASMAKYGEIPVSLYTGVPNISIPLYNLKIKNVEVPITLSYHAEGIRVEEMASNVGLGWSLVAGGCIKRQVRGLPDEQRHRSALQRDEISAHQLPTLSDWREFAEIFHGDADGEPDIFHYNFPGYSGKFALFPDGKYYAFPLNNLKIENLEDNYVRFKITTPNGCQYIFGYNLDYSDATIYDQGYNGNEYGTKIYSTSSFPTAWHLEEIILASGEKIKFTYCRITTTYKNRIQERLETLHASKTTYMFTPRIVEAWSISTASCNYIKTIETSQGKVIFEYDKDRIDIRGDKALTKVSMQNSLGELLQTYIFKYKYFTSNSLIDNLSNTNLSDDAISNYRLVLDCIEIGNNAGTYAFEYNRQRYLPSRFSKAVDHWGHYNGKEDNTSLIPTKYIEDEHNTIRFTAAADRAANFEYMQSGILKKITYPTGGHTTFTYEANNFTQGGNVEVTKGGLSENLPFEKWEGDETGEISKEITIEGEEYINQQKGASCRINISYFNYDPRKEHIIYKTVLIQGITNGIRYIFECKDYLNQNIPIYLPNGKYLFQLKMTDPYLYPETQESYALLPSIHWIGSYTRTVPLSKVWEGGLRIASIENYEQGGKLSNKKLFKYNEGDGGPSTGFLFMAPKYRKELIVCWPVGEDAILNVYSSISNYPLMQTQSSFVGYSKVTVDEVGQGKSIRTVYHFTQPLVYSYQHEERMWALPNNDYLNTNVPADFFDWYGGILFEQEEYKFENDHYKLIRTLRNNYTYTPAAPEQKALQGIKVKAYQDPVPTHAPYSSVEFYLGFYFYYLHTNWYHPESTIETTYDSSGNSFAKTTSYRYENPAHLLMTNKEESTSNGDKLIFTYRYPQDNLNGLTPEAKTAKNMLVEKYRLDELLEEESNTEDYPLHKKRINYSTDLWPTNIETRKMYNTLEKRILFKKRDVHGNVLEMQKDGTNSFVYIWGYQRQFPIAEIQNVSYAELQSVLSDNEIEEMAKKLQPSQIDWEKIKNLSAILPKAIVNIYTYTPLQGMTSATAPNGITTYYKYDMAGHLKEIYLMEDGVKKVIEAYNYHFQNQ